MTRRRRTYRKTGRKAAPQAPHVEVIASTPRRARHDDLHDDDDSDDGLGDLYLEMAVHAAALLGLGLQVHRIHKGRSRKKLTE